MGSNNACEMTGTASIDGTRRIVGNEVLQNLQKQQLGLNSASTWSVLTKSRNSNAF